MLDCSCSSIRFGTGDLTGIEGIDKGGLAPLASEGEGVERKTVVGCSRKLTSGDGRFGRPS